QRVRTLPIGCPLLRPICGIQVEHSPVDPLRLTGSHRNHVATYIWLVMGPQIGYGLQLDTRLLPYSPRPWPPALVRCAPTRSATVTSCSAQPPRHSPPRAKALPWRRLPLALAWASARSTAISPAARHSSSRRISTRWMRFAPRPPTSSRRTR